MSTERVVGPASYFPSIEKKYCRPMSYWQEQIRTRPDQAHGDRQLAEDRATASATATPTHWWATRSPRTLAELRSVSE